MPKLSSKKSPIKSARVKKPKKIDRGIKKILEPSRGMALVSFVNKKEVKLNKKQLELGKKSLKTAKKEVIIPLKNNQIKSFSIRLAENELDVYRSPHLLNLSEVGRKRGGQLAKAETKTSYLGWPGGKFLEKYGILRFWDLGESEIINWFRRGSERAVLLSKKAQARPKISSKLPSQINSRLADRPAWEDLSLVQLVLFFADLYFSIYLAIRKLFGRDETFWLTAPKPTVTESGQTAIDKLFISSDGPTIAEIIKSGQQQEKFKILSSRSRKEIREKYLQDNFNRKGVVINGQKPSVSWPKSSLFWDIGNLAFSSKAIKATAIFFGILIALTSSVKVASYWDTIMQTKGSVMGEAEQAINSVMTAEAGLKKMDFESARNDFAKANGNFVSAKNRLDDIKSFITVLAEVAPAQNTYKSGTNLIEMGEHLSLAAQTLLQGLTQASTDSSLSLASRIKNLAVELKPAVTEMELALKNSQNIGLNHLPSEHQEKFIKLKNSLPDAVLGLRQLRDSANFAVNVLGERGLKRYLLVFQNDNELRATGGFMGSFALVDFKNGKIEKVVIPEGGTYDLRAGFNQKMAPPKALSLLNNNVWEFQDSNWWPDFPTSAQNVKWFYEKSGGPSIDGVIAINSSFLGKLLTVTGPIDLPQYGKKIGADNFELELQKSIELEATEKTKPKKILGELSPILLERLLNVEPKDIFNLAEAFAGGLSAKEIQMYFADNELQQFALSNNWGGSSVAKSGQDYLQVVSTNIGGGKTDNVIKQKIYHHAEIQNDGSVIVSVLLERNHFGPTDNFFTQQSNNSYLRFYVPLGSELIKAVGFDQIAPDKFKTPETGYVTKSELAQENSARADQESGTNVYTENGKTVFANWSILSKQKSKEVLLVYRLPFKISPAVDKSLVEKVASTFAEQAVPYIFDFDKQAGRNNDELVSQISFPSNMSVRFNLPEQAERQQGSITSKTTTITDKLFVLGFSFIK